MNIKGFLVNITHTTLLFVILYCDGLQSSGCIWKGQKDGCLQNQFRCSDGTCINRASYCDLVNDCADGSDEECYSDGECASSELRRCELSSKCIPAKWFCDHVEDCDMAEDENCDDLLARERAVHWLKGQRVYRSPTNTWGASIDRVAVALYLGDYAWRKLNDGTRREMAYELSIQLLSQLQQEKLKDIPSNDLASYVNAFLVTCLNPRNFHGLDIVQELRSRVGLQNYTNPYQLLVLCNAGEAITETDIDKLKDAFENRRKTLWTDVQAFVIMALACANRKTGGVDLPHLSAEFLERLWTEATDNVQTKALVMQALISANYNPRFSNKMDALRKMIEKQDFSGAFGNIMNTYYALPVLNCQSLADIRSDHCETFYKNDTLTLDSVEELGLLKKVGYSVWLEDKFTFERSFVQVVPANATLFWVIRRAADLDGHGFEYVYQSGKPYVNSVYGKQDDPEKGKFWFLYSMEKATPVPIPDSPADVIPQDNDHYLLWYRNESWID